MPAHFDTRRHASLDALRGAAMVWMTAFHFCFDLQYLGWLRADFYQGPFWTLQRSLIVSLFLICAGAGQAMALEQRIGWAAFWRRWRQIAAAAVLVSLGSYLVFPQSFIYFGVLHGMALMLPITRWLGLRLRPAPLAALGAVLAVLPLAAPWLHHAWPQLEFLNLRAWNWLGLISHKPVTEDYVPLLPWLGVMLWGLAAGQWINRHRSAWLLARPARQLAPLTWLGKHSLLYYLLHQPVLLGLLFTLR